MLVPPPILASPTYDKCETLTLSFIFDFLISTKFPIFASFSIFVSSLRRANGPIDARS